MEKIRVSSRTFASREYCIVGPLVVMDDTQEGNRDEHE
jgi:hypothetical protein